MIISFASKETEKIWNSERVKKMPLEIQKVGRRKLRMLKKPDKFLKKGFRLDGRKRIDLRPISLSVGIVPNADGSAYIEQGNNKILVAVYGPKELHPKHLARSDRTVLRCRYHMAPFSVQERKSPAPG